MKTTAGLSQDLIPPPGDTFYNHSLTQNGPQHTLQDVNFLGVSRDSSYPPAIQTSGMPVANNRLISNSPPGSQVFSPPPHPPPRDVSIDYQQDTTVQAVGFHHGLVAAANLPISGPSLRSELKSQIVAIDPSMPITSGRFSGHSEDVSPSAAAERQQRLQANQQRSRQKRQNALTELRNLVCPDDSTSTNSSTSEAEILARASRIITEDREGKRKLKEILWSLGYVAEGEDVPLSVMAQKVRQLLSQ